MNSKEIMQNWYTNMTDLYRGRIVQYAAISIILTAVVGTMAMFAYQTLFNLPTPSWENTFLITSITVAANTFGYHQGSVTANGTINSTLHSGPIPIVAAGPVPVVAAEKTEEET